MNTAKNETGGGALRRVKDRSATCYVCRRPAFWYDGWVYLWGGRPYCAAYVPDDVATAAGGEGRGQ